MSWSSPCSRPAWQAPVWEDQLVSHSCRWWPSSCIQRASVGALPSRIARRSTSCASPSISRQIRPGTSVRVASLARLSWRTTMWRYQRSPRSSASTPLSSVVSAVRPSTTTSAVQASSIWTSSSNRLMPCSSSALSTSAPRPSVATVNGSATRSSTGHTTAFATPSATARINARPGRVEMEARQDPGEREQRDGVQDQDEDEAADQADRQGGGKAFWLSGEGASQRKASRDAWRRLPSVSRTPLGDNLTVRRAGFIIAGLTLLVAIIGGILMRVFDEHDFPTVGPGCGSRSRPSPRSATAITCPAAARAARSP